MTVPLAAVTFLQVHWPEQTAAVVATTAVGVATTAVGVATRLLVDRFEQIRVRSLCFKASNSKLPGRQVEIDCGRRVFQLVKRLRRSYYWPWGRLVGRRGWGIGRTRPGDPEVDHFIIGQELPAALMGRL